eukprot:TRINITY_DN12206_c0_g4_i2.p2 TRINITY_DN12206_c0_g4~~TRINITY_DN12206_c0_g4_i2.p2  ORF type:complete len:141 (-),score=2.12 TRINITY_DN12206_c0_g4_i2:354-776(-)
MEQDNRHTPIADANPLAMAVSSLNLKLSESTPMVVTGDRTLATPFEEMCSASGDRRARPRFSISEDNNKVAWWYAALDPILYADPETLRPFTSTSFRPSKTVASKLNVELIASAMMAAVLEGSYWSRDVRKDIFRLPSSW